MDDAALAKALAPLGKVQLGVRSGWVRIWQPDVEAEGLDVAAVEVFVLRKGGEIEDKPPRVRRQLGGSQGRAQIFPRSYLLPVEALAD